VKYSNGKILKNTPLPTVTVGEGNTLLYYYYILLPSSGRFTHTILHLPHLHPFPQSTPITLPFPLDTSPWRVSLEKTTKEHQ
jgi:hypothetical protein